MGNLFRKSSRNKDFYFYSIFSIITAILLILFYYVDEEFYSWFADEDSLAENLSAVFFFLTGLILLLKSLRKIKKGVKFQKEVLFILLGLGFLFAAGEEISWGQRIFNIPTSEFLMKYNAQQEISSHNLFFFHTSLYNPNTITDVFVFVMGIFIPVCCFFIPSFRNYLEKFNFPIIQISFLPIFLMGLIYGLVMVQITHHHPFAPNEIKEFIYSVGFLLYSIALITSSRLKRSPEHHDRERKYGCYRE